MSSSRHTFPLLQLTLVALACCGCSSEPPAAPVSGGTGLVGTGARLVKNSKGVVTAATLLNTETTDAELSELGEYDQIERLRIQECKAITGSGLKVVESLPNLNNIEVILTPVTDEGLLHLQNAAALERVLLNQVDAGNDGLAFLSGCAEIQHLTLSGMQISDDGLKHLSGLQKATVVSLSNCSRVAGPGLGELAGLTSLEELDLTGTGVIPDHPEHLRPLTNVREIRFDTHQINDNVVAVLGEMQNLQKLNLHKSQVSDDGMKHVRNMQGLQKLEVSSCGQVTNAGILALEGHPSLTELDLSANRQLNDDCLSGLATIKTLKVVKLQDSGCTAEGARTLKGALPECRIVYGSSPNTEQL